MKPQELTVEWLTKKAMTLLENASGSADEDGNSQEKIDHQACSKYLDILFKVLPKKSMQVNPEANLAELREMLDKDRVRDAQ